MSEIQQKMEEQVATAQARLNHLPFVLSHSQRMVTWTDVKECLFLWCASPTCCVVLNALKHHFNYPASQSAIRPCTYAEQRLFKKLFVVVTPGTLLIDLDALRESTCIMALHDVVRTKHKKSRDPGVIYCNKMLLTLTKKYGQSCFHVLPETVENMKLLPAIRRVTGPVMMPAESLDAASDTENLYVPLACLQDMFPECATILDEGGLVYIQVQPTSPHLPPITQASMEEGTQISRFLASYNGYGEPWQCVTSSSLMMLWSQFWSGIAYNPSLQHINILSDVSLILVDTERSAVDAAAEWIKQEPECEMDARSRVIYPTEKLTDTCVLHGPVNMTQLSHLQPPNQTNGYSITVLMNDPLAPLNTTHNVRTKIAPFSMGSQNSKQIGQGGAGSNNDDVQSEQEVHLSSNDAVQPNNSVVETSRDCQIRSKHESVSNIKDKGGNKTGKALNGQNFKKSRKNNKKSNNHDCESLSVGKVINIDNALLPERNLRVNQRRACKISGDSNYERLLGSQIRAKRIKLRAEKASELPEVSNEKRRSKRSQHKGQGKPRICHDNGTTHTTRTGDQGVTKQERAETKKETIQSINTEKVENSLKEVDDILEIDKTACTNATIIKQKAHKQKCTEYLPQKESEKDAKEQTFSKYQRKDSNNSADVDLVVDCTSKDKNMNTSPDCSYEAKVYSVTKPDYEYQQKVVISCPVTAEPANAPSKKIGEISDEGTYTSPVKKRKPKSAVSFATTADSPTQSKAGRLPNRQRVATQAERLTLQVNSAVIKDNLPLLLSSETTLPGKHFENNIQTKYVKRNSSQKQETPDFGQSTDNSYNNIGYKNLNPKQIELNPPPPKPVPKPLTSGEIFPYKATRQFSGLGGMNSIFFGYQCQQALALNPIVTGCIIQASPRKTHVSRSKSVKKCACSTDIHEKSEINSASLKQQKNDGSDRNSNHISEDLNQKETVAQKAQANDNTGTVFNAQELSDFQNERMTMWKDMIVSQPPTIQGRRLIKSADIGNKREVSNCYRQMSSIHGSANRSLQRDNVCVRTAFGTVTSRDRENVPVTHEKQQSCEELQEEIPASSDMYDNIKRTDITFDINYGSSSSTTPDIYDGFASRRRPTPLKVEATHIKAKPKQISKISSPHSLSVKKTSKDCTQSQSLLNSKTQTNHHTDGYSSSPSLIINKQQYSDLHASADIMAQEKYQHMPLSSSLQRNLLQLAQLPQHLHSSNVHCCENTSNFEPSCRMCREQLNLAPAHFTYSKAQSIQYPAHKPCQKPLIVCGSSYQTPQVSNTVNPQQMTDSPSPIKQTFSNTKMWPVRSTFVSDTPKSVTEQIPNQPTTMSASSVNNIVQCKLTLLDKVSTFSRDESVFTLNVMNENIISSKNISHAVDSPKNEEWLTMIDTQLYYTVDGENKLYPVTGDTVIPNKAKFYTRSNTSIKREEQQVQQDLNDQTPKELPLDQDEKVEIKNQHLPKTKEADGTPIKTLIALKPQQSKTQVPAKSFREVIEEQRAVKKKDESARSCGRENHKKSATGTYKDTRNKMYIKNKASEIRREASSTVARKSVLQKKSQGSVKSAGGVKMVNSKSNISRSTSCNSNKISPSINTYQRTRPLAFTKSPQKKSAKKCGDISKRRNDSALRQINESTMRIISALRRLKLDKYTQCEKKIFEDSTRKNRQRSCIERQILGGNKTQRKYITSNHVPKVSSAKKAEKKESKLLPGNENFDHKSTPDDPIFTAVEKINLEERMEEISTKSNSPKYVDDTNVMYTPLPMKTKNKNMFLTQSSLQESADFSNTSDRNTPIDVYISDSPTDLAQVNINMNSVSVIDATEECEIIPTYNKGLAQCKEKIQDSNIKYTREAHVEVICAENGVSQNTASETYGQHEAPCVDHTACNSEDFAVNSSRSSDESSSLTDQNSKYSSPANRNMLIADANEDIGAVLSIQEDDNLGLKVAISSSPGKFKNLQSDNPSYQNVLQFYQEHGLTQMFERAMEYFQRFSKQHVAEPLLSKLDLVALTEDLQTVTENDSSSTYPESESSVILQENQNDEDSASFASEVFQISHMDSYNKKNIHCATKSTHKTSKNMSEQSKAAVENCFDANKHDDNTVASHSDNIFDALNGELLKIKEVGKVISDKSEHTILKNVMLNSASDTDLVLRFDDEQNDKRRDVAGLENIDEENEEHVKQHVEYLDEADIGQEVFISDDVYDECCESWKRIEGFNIMERLVGRGFSSNESIQVCRKHKDKTKCKDLKRVNNESPYQQARQIYNKSQKNIQTNKSKKICPLTKTGATELKQMKTMHTFKRLESVDENEEGSVCEVYIDVDGVVDEINDIILPTAESENEKKYYEDDELILDEDDNKDEDYIPDVSEDEDDDNDEEVEDGNRRHEVTIEMQHLNKFTKKKNVTARHVYKRGSLKNSLNKLEEKTEGQNCNLEKIRKTFEETHGLKESKQRMVAAVKPMSQHTDQENHRKETKKIKQTRKSNPAKKKQLPKVKSPKAKKILNTTNSKVSLASTSDDEDILNSTWRLTEKDLAVINVELDASQARKSVSTDTFNSEKSVVWGQSKRNHVKTEKVRTEVSKRANKQLYTSSTHVDKESGETDALYDADVNETLQEGGNTVTGAGVAERLSVTGAGVAEGLSATGAGVAERLSVTGAGVAERLSVEGGNTVTGAGVAERLSVKKTKTKKKSAARGPWAEDSDDSYEERPQREGQSAAEAFIRQQQMYYEIIKNSATSTPSKVLVDRLPVVFPDMSEVLSEIPVQGDREISRAASEAEKALEGTGSLSEVEEEDEGVIIEDLVNSCRYQLVEDEDKINLGGMCYFRDFVLPFVYINGYKFTSLKDVLTMFQPRICSKACRIPRSVLQKQKSLMKTFSTWEQVYKIELIKMKKGPSVMTGDVLLKLDCLISQLPALIQQIVEKHQGSRLKHSQNCPVYMYSTLIGRSIK